MPELVDCLERLVTRIEETPFDRKGMKSPMVAEAKDLLKRISELDQIQAEGCEPGASRF